MRLWLRRLSALLVVALLGLVLLVIGALIFLDGEDYKQPFAWVAETFFDSELIISGPLRVHVSSGLQLHAQGVQFKPRDGSYFLSADVLGADIRLRDALVGTLWVRNIALTDFFLRINESDSADKFDWNSFTFPPVVIEKANIDNLTVEYQEISPDTLHSFTLAELAIDEVNDSGPVTLKAQGLLEGRSFSLDGSFPPLDHVFDDQTPKPVSMTLEGDRIHARLDGTITDPVNGKGMDLKLELEVPEAQELLEIFADDIPAVGVFKAAARLQGDYADPRLTEIDASLHREQEVALTLTGSVEDILTGRGMNLHLAGYSDKPSVASWLLFKKLGGMQSLRVDGKVEESNGLFYLTEVNAVAKTSAGLSITASGDAELYAAGHVFTVADKGLNLKVTAPSVAALNVLKLEGIPEFGAVSGTLKVIASRDAVGIYDAVVQAGSRKSSVAHLKGQVAYIPFPDVTGTTGIDLQVNIKSADVTALAKKFGYTYEQPGPGSVDTHVSGDLNRFSLDKTSVSVGRKDELLMTAKGKADSIVFNESTLQANANFDVEVSTPDLSDLSALAGMNLPTLGATHMNSNLVIRNTELAFENLKINIGAQDQPTVRINGKVITLLDKGSSVDIRFDVAVGDLAAALTGKPPGYLGRMHGTAGVSDVDGSWGVTEFTLVSSDTSLYKVDIGGQKNQSKSDRYNVRANIDINDPAALGAALDMDLSGYSSFHSEGVLSGTESSLSYQATGSVGRTSSTTTIEGRLVNGKPNFKGKFEIPVLYLSDFGFDPSVADTGPVKVDLDSPGHGDIFSREPLDVGLLNKFDLDFDILVDQVESHHQMSIDSIKAHINLKDGNLRVDPLRFLYEGGTMDVVFDLQAKDTPVYKLQVTADDLKLGPMMSQVQNDVPINGYSDINMDVTASGQSPHEIASSLDGEISLGFENARVPSKYIQFLSVDVFGWALSTAFHKDKYADLNCVIAKFEAADGKIKSTVLIADGPRLSLGGSIRLNLRKETMKIVILPKQKHKLFSSISPVTIKGPMRDPHVEAIPATAAIQEIGTMALVPYVYVPLKLVSKLWSIVDDGDKAGQGCASVKAVGEEAEKQLQKEAQQ